MDTSFVAKILNTRFVLGIIVDVDVEGGTRQLNIPSDSPGPPSYLLGGIF